MVDMVLWCNLQPTIPETPGQTPSLSDKCTGVFYMHYTTYRTYGLTSNPKDTVITVKLLANTSVKTCLCIVHCVGPWV